MVKNGRNLHELPYLLLESVSAIDRIMAHQSGTLSSEYAVDQVPVDASINRPEALRDLSPGQWPSQSERQQIIGARPGVLLFRRARLCEHRLQPGALALRLPRPAR